MPDSEVKGKLAAAVQSLDSGRTEEALSRWLSQ